MALAREPARPHDPGYPTFSEFDPSRRAALRAIALAGLSAAGLQLVGCPRTPPPTGTPAPDTGAPPATETGPPPDTDWVPWKEPQTEGGPVGPVRPMGGAVAPRQMDEPVAIVVGGGPIDVVFSDGRKARLAVALVVQPGTTPGAVKCDAPEHVAAVKAAALSLPGTVCDSAQGHEALSTRIQEEVRDAVPGLVIEGVQAAPIHEPGDQSRAAPPPTLDAPAAAAPPAARAAPSAAPARAGAVAPVSAKPVRAPLSGKRVWIPCGKPGCTSCGK